MSERAGFWLCTESLWSTISLTIFGFFRLCMSLYESNSNKSLRKWTRNLKMDSWVGAYVNLVASAYLRCPNTPNAPKAKWSFISCWTCRATVFFPSVPFLCFYSFWTFILNHSHLLNYRLFVISIMGCLI